MNGRFLLAVAALLAASTAAHAETDPYAAYPITVKQSGHDKEKTYFEVRKEVLGQCDLDGGYIDTLNFQFLEGWGAAQGMHFVVANATCRQHR